MNRVTRADLIEVPLPSGGTDGVCMPLVVMQPTADASDYMLKPNYATNGRPGVVDHAVLADLASTVVWQQITNLPSVFPPAQHGAHHIELGGDPIPLATTSSDGLLMRGTGQPNDYLAGDLVFRHLAGLAFFRSEGDATIDPSFTAGAVIFTGLVTNPVYACYTISQFYLYAANPSFPPAGKIHFDIFDPAIPGWVQVTDSTEINPMTSPLVLLSPVLNTTAMNRVWSAGPNSLSWRMVLDQPSGLAAYMRVGVAFGVLQLNNPITLAPGGLAGPPI